MKIDKMFNVSDNLKIKEEWVGFHSLNPFIAYTSSARAYMMSSHISQTLVLEDGDESIIQSGLEKQFGKNTFSKKFLNDSRIIKVIPRYRGISSTSVTSKVEYLVIFENLETGEVDYLDLPPFHALHKDYGFRYRPNEEAMKDLFPGNVIRAGTVLQDSPAVTKNNGYKYGVNANMALMNIPETAEDGVVISKSLAEKLRFRMIETRVVEFGTNSFPLNMYGDENNYKPFPEIGDTINEESVLMVLREYDERLSAGLTSVKDVMDFNPIFDKAIYVKSSGKEYDIKGNKEISGRVIDIKVYKSPKFKKDTYTGVADCVDKYVNALKQYYGDILEVYNELMKDHYTKFKNNDLKLSNKFHRLIVEALSVNNPDNHKISYSNRNEQLDLYRMVFTIEYLVPINIGYKISDKAGSKGVVVDIWDDIYMPIDKDGNRADIIMDGGSVVSRMNVSRMYEHYFNAISRKTRLELRKIIPQHVPVDKYEPKSLHHAWDIVLGLLKILDTEQYQIYKELKDEEQIKSIIHECINEEVYLLYKVSSKKKPYDIIKEIKGSIYEPTVDKVSFKDKVSGEIKMSKYPIMISPIYTILLSKTPENFLAVSGAKTNHYGLPVGVGNNVRDRLPWRNSPTKTLSETEVRLYLSYVSRKGIIELKDRANSIPTHEAVYENILNADQPGNIDVVVDRSKQPYGEDASLELVNNIFNAAGISIDYSPNK